MGLHGKGRGIQIEESPDGAGSYKGTKSAAFL
jgi:hypothetical protein